MITLSDGATTLTLHPDLYWSDETNWYPVEQTARRTVTGALIVQSFARIAGRPITLEPINDGSGWITLAVDKALRNWAAVVGKQMVLTLRGVAHNVVFRHQDGGYQSVQVQYTRSSDQDDAQFVLPTLRLMEI